MAFITGMMLIDAPASALNNRGAIQGATDDNTVGVKMLRTRNGTYPYVSAQAFRYWLRETIADTHPELPAAPVFREKKVAYADANPILYWDDDLLGYMRAPSTKTDAVKARKEDASRAGETPTTSTITRVSPFRVGTLVSIAPVQITEDFGVMSRHEGDPVIHVHQFYRATLQGLFSLDLHASGTFSYRQKTGYRNLDDERIELAKETGLVELDGEKAYRLPQAQRVERIGVLLDGMAQLQGGAKLTLHYTDVSPVVTMLAVTKGGNHIFRSVIGADKRDNPVVNLEALQEVLSVFSAEILSPIYVGWTKGYQDDERARLEAFAGSAECSRSITISHPREAFQALIAASQAAENSAWLE
jgi:CRISPR-associated protein Cst2